MSATAFQRRRRELARKAELEQEILMVPVADDMTVMGRERTAADQGPTTEAQGREPKASATAIKLAAERGVNLRQVTGTGADGAITVTDVKRTVDPSQSPE